jgi:hypothetical protein
MHRIADAPKTRDEKDCCCVKVEVRCKLLENVVARMLGLRHCFFVIEDCDGNRHTLGAYAENDKKPYGKRISKIDAPSDLRVKDTANKVPFAPKKGEDQCDLLDCIMAKDSAGVGKPYDPKNHNSNGYVADIMKACGNGKLPASAPTNQAGAKDYLISVFMAPPHNKTREEATKIVEQLAKGL